MPKQLSNSEKKELCKQLSMYCHVISKNDIAVVHDGILIINGQKQFFNYKNQWVPTLRFLKPGLMKSIYIDKGAIKFIVNGADIMRPGITSVDEGIQADEVVAVRDSEHHKAIAMGTTLYSTEDIRRIDKGKVLINIHHVNDKIWNEATIQ